MKIIHTILIICMTMPLWAQTQSDVKKINLHPIEYGLEFARDSSGIYIGGFTYQVKDYDGFNSDAYLRKYNKNLELIWEIKIGENESADIKQLSHHDNKLYALVTRGKHTVSTVDVDLYLYIVSASGEVEQIIRIGKNYSWPTNLVFTDNKVHFAYAEPNTIEYGAMSTKVVLVEYHLRKGHLSKKEGQQGFYTTRKLVVCGSAFYVIGQRRIHDKEYHYIDCVMTFEGQQPLEKLLHSERRGCALDAYVSDDRIVLLSSFNGGGEHPEKYLKYTYYDPQSDISTENIVSLQELNWQFVRIEKVFNEGQSTWLMVKRNEGEKYFVQVDSKGQVLAEIPYLDQAVYVNYFAIYPDFQLYNNLKDLYYTQAKRILPVGKK